MLNRENIGKRIAFFRKEKGITQRELADFLHISYQAVSKWESGKCLPTVDMLYEISMLLNVTADVLLSEDEWKNRRIAYRDSGLDVQKLHALKTEIMKLNAHEQNILSADYADACLFQIDTAKMREPVYACITCVPGSKEKLAKEYRYNQEICADVAANAMNFILQHGMKTVILKAMVVCGNYNQEQLYLMAQAFQQICQKNEVSFTGMEISSQPLNFHPEEYEISVTVVGVQDKDKLLVENRLQEGDVLIGIQTEGIDATNYPFVKMMLDRRPGLYHAKIDENSFFLDELMKANVAFTREIAALQEKGYLHMAFRMGNTLLNDKTFGKVPEGLGACIDLGALPILPLYRFLLEQDMIGETVFPYHFHMGIGMIVAVPQERGEEAMKVIRQYSNCWRIGVIKADEGHKGEKVWSKGKLSCRFAST